VINELNKATLSVHCSEQGFNFKLQCSDGKSWANSQLFTWQQIVQLLIAVNPDMFGILDEPLHQVYPKTIQSLGYNIPNWNR
jgi:predicted ATPase